ncbi:MAG: MFS transporter [Gammaproteobacteria bacterium]|nr:MFS transporter [Gammaproteobacteria bacterium]
MPVLLLVIVLSGMGFGLVLPAFLFFAENLGATPIIATTIIGLYSLGQFIANPVWGRMSDKFGRKPILMLSTAGMLVAYIVMAFSENLWMLGLARFLTGVMGANVPVAMAYITDITPPEKRAQGMGYVGGAISIGFIIGPAFGGFLSGADATSATLLWPGIGAAILCLVTLVAMSFLDESLPAEKRLQASNEAKKAEHPTGFAAMRMVAKRPTITRLILIGFMIYLAMGFFETIMPLWSQRRFGWGPQEIGWCFTWLGLVVAITQGYLIGKLVPRFGESKMALIGVSCYCFGLLWMTQVSFWPLMVFGITFTAAGNAISVTSMTSLVSRQAGEHERGLVLGVYNSSSWIGRFMAPPMSGGIFQAVAVQAPLYAAAGILMLCFLMVQSLRSHLKREDTARQASTD